MSSTTKKQLANIFTMAVVALTAFQGLIPQMPITNPTTITLVSAITMFLVTALTAWKQYVSEGISNAAINSTVIMAVLATLGGLNDLFAVFPLGATAGQWVRFGVTAITLILNIVSKVMWPAPENNIIYKARA